jgi:hypothetical protein
VMRMDRRTMELQDIQPQGADDDDPERWNWDCPILVSPHSAGTIYVASQRVWRSADRGDSWTAISGDLTRNINRYELPVDLADEGGLVQSVDALWDHMAMSMYSTVTHLSESPITPGVLVAGSDDGLVHVTNDGGASWRTAGPVPEFPTDGFINNVKASQHDDAVIFLAADAHKNGDYTPYVFVSSDQGVSWQSISGDLPEDTIVWAIEQDHVDPELLFIGAEYGVHVSVNGGQNWHKLAGAPPISFRDIVLHRPSGPRSDGASTSSMTTPLSGICIRTPSRPMQPCCLSATLGGTCRIRRLNPRVNLPWAPLRSPRRIQTLEPASPITSAPMFCR